MPDNMRIGLSERQITVAGSVVAVGIRGEHGGADPAIAIRDRTTPFEPHAVHHAVADEPVRGDAGARIRAVAQIPAGQLGRDGAGYRQLGRAEFGGDRGEAAE